MRDIYGDKKLGSKQPVKGKEKSSSIVGLKGKAVKVNLLLIT
jgi:hypothetical protein